MATVAPEPTTRTKFDARVEAEIGKAVGRIRANDLLLGGLAMATLLLTYTVGMVLLDRWLVLSMSARQAALGGFVLAMGLVGWLFLVRPLRRTVNPRYAARRVEETVTDSKNAVINWVDLQDRDLPTTVRTAVGQKAAGQLIAADVSKATEAKPVVWLGAAAGLLAAALAILFVVLKPAPFTSLVKRTFSPFVDRAIATRTVLTLTEPALGDVTVTAGESMTVAVDVQGSVPDADGPNRVRLQVWHTDTQTEVDELPLEPGAGNDWRLTLTPSVIQNGFWFRVVGGDSRTGDHRVTVRSRPLVTAFEAKYESPAYTRIPVETAREPKLEGYRGTKVTLQARTNRQVKRGYLQLDNRPDTIPATIVGDSRDTLQFELTLTESGRYRIGFTSANDETSEPTPPFPVNVLTDQPPTLTITKPTEETVTLPANGTLAVDGEAADDFGLARVTLRMQVVAPIKFDLQPKPYREGKSFRRQDGSYPTRLADADGSQTGYKETVPLAELKDTSGKPLAFDQALVIEYWLEATDNCTEPKPNIAVSPRKKLRLSPAVEGPKKQEQDNRAAARKTEQQNHEKAQDKKLGEERRDPKQVHPDSEKQPGDQPPQQEGQPQQGQPKESGQGKSNDKTEAGGQPQSGNDAQSKPKEGTTAAQQHDQPPKSDPDGPGGGEPSNAGTDPKQPENGKPDATKGTTGNKSEGSKGGGKPEPAPQQKDLDRKAEKVQDALRETGEPGTGFRPEAPMPRSADEPKQPSGGQPSAADQAATKEQERQKQQAINDLSSDDPARKQASRDKLDQMVGQKERERIEKLQQDLNSDDPEIRKKAEKELGELDRETGTSGAGVRNNRQEDVERLSRELNSENPTTRKNAERRAERDYGKQGRDDLQKAGEKLNSQDQQKQEEGKKDVDELMKKDKKKKEQPQGGDQQPKGGDKSAADQVRQQSNDLTSPDDAKRQAAEQAMDQKIGPDARKDLQQKLGSKDEAQRQAGQQQVEKMAQQAGSGSDPKPTPEQMKELTDAAKDLSSGDTQKQQAARDKLDKQLGETGRQQLEQDLKDLQSDDPARQKAVQQKLQDAAKKMGGGEKSPDQQPKGPTKEQIDRAAETARDLTSPDQAKRQAAEQKLDQQMGPEKRKELQKNLNDLKNGTPEQQAEAARKIGDMAKEAAETAGQKPPTPEQMKDLADAAKDLNSTDPAKKEAAEQKLDQAIGKPAREQLQKDQAAKQPDPKATRDVTEQALAGDKGKQPDPAEVEKKMKDLADTAKDLNSTDPAKKEAAERKLDEQIGKQAREQVQEMQKDLQSQDPKTREAAQQKLQQAMDQLKGKFDPKQPWRPGGGAVTDLAPGKKYEDDPANRLKTAELQLKTFEKNKDNKALLDKLGYTAEEYERFLADYARRVEQIRAEANRPKPATTPKAPTGPPTVTVAEGAGKREQKDGVSSAGGAATGKPTPGYTDAQKRFAAGAAKGGKPPAEAPKKP